jgi:hypothetical protein
MLPLHHHLKDLLTQNTGEVLQQLRQVFANKGEAYNEVILLAGRHERLKRTQREGTMSAEEENREINKINKAILELIDQITPEEATAYDLSTAIFQRILVVGKVPEREAELRRLFPERYFKGVEFDFSGRPLAPAEVNSYELIIFDDYAPGEQGDGHEHELLRHYLKHTAPYVLYFGPPGLRLKEDERDTEKIYFANSPFSLHARLEEMRAHLKYTRG